MDRPIFYVASPFSHHDEAIRADRAKQARMARVELLRVGVMNYTPIALSCDEERTLPHSWDFWHGPSINMLSRCDGLLVLQLDGWSESVGVRAEIKWAHENFMPTWYWDSVTTPAAAIAEVLNCVKRRVA